MNQVMEHIQQFYIAYIIGAVVLLPILYFTRKWSVPAIMYVIEITIYLFLMHLTVWLLVGLTRWFKENSSMKALREDGRPVDSPDWSTPLLEFWKRAEYHPEWLQYVEVAAVVLIIVLVWRYRPMKFQKKKNRRKFKNEGGARKAGRPTYPGAVGGAAKPGARPGAADDWD